MSELKLHNAPRHLSYSQVSTLSDCGERYRLQRLWRVPAAPSWALVGGGAVHVATELIDHAAINYQGRLDIGQTPVRSLSCEGSAANPALVQPEGVALTGTDTKLDEANSCTKSSTSGELPAHKNPTGVGAEGAPGASQDVRRGSGTPAVTLTPGGDGDPVYTIPELWDLVLSAAIESEAAKAPTPFQDRSTWRASGRKSAEWPDKENHAWWAKSGPLMLEKYVSLHREGAWRVAQLDGLTPAIEVDVTGRIGSVEIAGFADRIFLDRDGNPVLVDIKSGSREPSSSEQLGLYAVLLTTIGFPPISEGRYYMTRSGKMSEPRDLNQYSYDYFKWKYETMRDMRDKGLFVANTGSQFCSSCEVRDFCRPRGGKNSHLVPPPWDKAVVSNRRIV